MLEICSNSNDKIKKIIRLKNSSKFRQQENSFIVEGIRIFKEIPIDDIKELYIIKELYYSKIELFEKVSLDKIILLERNVFSHISDTVTPQGVLAVVEIKNIKLEDLLKEDNPFFVIIEKLQDPGNLGTIIRSSEAAGVSGIIISEETVDLYNPKVIRSTMGSIFRIPIFISDKIIETLEEMKNNNIIIYAAHLDGKNLYNEKFTSSCGILIGNEGNGLSSSILSYADKLIKIPMNGKVESLNAAFSATILAYEVMRQRS